MTPMIAGLMVLTLAAGEKSKYELAEPVRKIWDQGKHNAFTDLIRFQNQWVCVFREGEGHAKGAGVIRVLRSTDGKSWASAARIAQDGVDLRDPHLAITPRGELMIVGGAAVPPTRDPVKDHFSFVCFSKNGADWTRPEKTVKSWQWLWRVRWHKDDAFGVAYRSDSTPPRKYEAILFQSKDARTYKPVTTFTIPNATEATIAFDGDTMLCLQRRNGKPDSAQIGVSKAPYTDWMWKDLGVTLGGPNLIRSPDGVWLASGRMTVAGKPQTVLCELDVNAGKLTPMLTLPSGGDTSYAGMVWHEGELWMTYYSSHEKKAAIYLARVRKGK